MKSYLRSVLRKSMLVAAAFGGFATGLAFITAFEAIPARADYDWQSSPTNPQNAAYNFDNSEFNPRNRPESNSVDRRGTYRITGTLGQTIGYMVHKFDGGRNYFDTDGKRIGYGPSGVASDYDNDGNQTAFDVKLVTGEEPAELALSDSISSATSVSSVAPVTE